MTHERAHLNARLEVQLRTVDLYPDDLNAADELERIRALLLDLDLRDQELERELDMILETGLWDW